MLALYIDEILQLTQPDNRLCRKVNVVYVILVFYLLGERSLPIRILNLIKDLFVYWTL